MLKTHWFWDQMPPSFEKFDVTLAFEFVGNTPHYKINGDTACFSLYYCLQNFG